MTELLTDEELAAIENRRNLMGGLMSICVSEKSKPAFVAAFDDSELMQATLADLQKEVTTLRQRVETQRDMIDDLLEELHG